MRREVPLVITFVVGIILSLNYIFTGPIPGTQLTLGTVVNTYLQPWALVISAFAVGLASVNLIRIHGNYISRKRSGWYNSIVLLIFMAIFAIVGIYNQVNPDSKATIDWYQKLYQNLLVPLGNASFALLAFYIGSASYRAFRARSAEAAVLLIGALIVMLGAAPIGALIWSQFPVIQKWLLDVPNVTGQRAVIIGAAIGGFATSLRILLGLDRGYLGGGE